MSTDMKTDVLVNARVEALKALEGTGTGGVYRAAKTVAQALALGVEYDVLLSAAKEFEFKKREGALSTHVAVVRAARIFNALDGLADVITAYEYASLLKDDVDTILSAASSPDVKASEFEAQAEVARAIKATRQRELAERRAMIGKALPKANVALIQALKLVPAGYKLSAADEQALADLESVIAKFRAF